MYRARTCDLGFLVETMGRFRERRADLLLVTQLWQAWTSCPGTAVVRQPTASRTQRRLGPTEVTELASAYEAGATLEQLTSQFAIHRSTAFAHLNRRGVSRRPTPGLSPTQLDQAIDLYISGDSLLSVGQALGFSANTIRRYLLSAGVKLRPRRGWNNR
jgi:hypothetical protein